MFDIAFSELVVIAIVALIVIGPEKLPKVARTVGTMVGRMQRYMSQIKEEVNREARFAELQKLQQEIQQTADGARVSLYGEVKSFTDAVEPTPPNETVVSQEHSPTSIKS